MCAPRAEKIHDTCAIMRAVPVGILCIINLPVTAIICANKVLTRPRSGGDSLHAAHGRGVQVCYPRPRARVSLAPIDLG